MLPRTGSISIAKLKELTIKYPDSVSIQQVINHYISIKTTKKKKKIAGSCVSVNMHHDEMNDEN